MVCNVCCHVLTDHIEAQEQEYDHLLHGALRQQKVRITTKNKNELKPPSPSGQNQRDHLSLNQEEMDQNFNQLSHQISRFFADDVGSKALIQPKNHNLHQIKVETPEMYIEAFRQILMDCAEQFYHKN